MAKFESADIDIPNESAPGLKAWQSIGCKKDKAYVLSFDGKKPAPALNKKKDETKIV